MEEEIEIAKSTFSRCAEGVIDCTVAELVLNRESPQTQIINFEKMKISEYLKVIGLSLK